MLLRTSASPVVSLQLAMDRQGALLKVEREFGAVGGVVDVGGAVHHVREQALIVDPLGDALGGREVVERVDVVAGLVVGPRHREIQVAENGAGFVGVEQRERLRRLLKGGLGVPSDTAQVSEQRERRGHAEPVLRAGIVRLAGEFEGLLGE